MKALIVEDEFISRSILTKIFSQFGTVDVAVNGEEAIAAFKSAASLGQQYDVICLDIMMPNTDGREVLRTIRAYEEGCGIVGKSGVKIIMTTGVEDSKEILGSFRDGCESYLIKPIDKLKLYNELSKLGFEMPPKT